MSHFSKRNDIASEGSWPVLAAWDRLVQLGASWWAPTRCPALYNLAYRTRQRNVQEYLDQLRHEVNALQKAEKR